MDRRPGETAGPSGLVRRMVTTLVAVFVVDAVFVVVLASLLWPVVGGLWYASGQPPLAVAVVALLLAVLGLAWAQFGYAKTQLVAAVDAEPATHESHPELVATVNRLAATADLREPSVAVAEDDVPNSFAVGTPRESTIVVTTGLLDRLSPDQLEAVLAHELAHVKNHDATVLTLASFLPSVAAGDYSPIADRIHPAIVAAFLLGLHLLGLLLFDVPTAGLESLVGAAVLLGVGLLFGRAALGVLAAPVLVFSRRLSRDREFVADRAGALISGNPTALATALETLSAATPDTSDLPPDTPKDDARTALRGLYLLERPGEAAWDSTHSHPPVAERIERLGALAAELEQ